MSYFSRLYVLLEFVLEIEIIKILSQTKSDVVYKFAWCIDACIRARQISELHQRELFEFLSTVRFWVAKTAKIRHNSNRTYTYEKQLVISALI